MSRATISVPDKLICVFIGYLLKVALTLSIPSFRLTLTIVLANCSLLTSGSYFDGSRSSFSINTPFLVTLTTCWRSALQLTPRPTGQDAPCRGRRTTRTSWQKYLPPNWAPMPSLCVSLWILSSASKSLNARPCSFPLVWILSKKRAEASLTVFKVYSAESPPTTTAKCYGGQADVPKVCTFSSMNF